MLFYCVSVCLSHRCICNFLWDQYIFSDSFVDLVRPSQTENGHSAIDDQQNEGVVPALHLCVIDLICSQWTVKGKVIGHLFAELERTPSLRLQAASLSLICWHLMALQSQVCLYQIALQKPFTGTVREHWDTPWWLNHRNRPPKFLASAAVRSLCFVCQQLQEEQRWGVLLLGVTNKDLNEALSVTDYHSVQLNSTQIYLQNP